MQRQFTAVYRRDGKWWAAYVEELPGANTQGKTIEEARENLKEAIALMLEFNREKAEQELKGAEVLREELVVTTA
jgi:predicted RNase H-like HicB family nuclease